MAETLLARARAIAARARKDDDFLWARLTGRPPAALLLALLGDRCPTPNALSLLSLPLGLASAAAFAFCPGGTGLWAGFALGQLAYIVDCMDGMAARAHALHSPAGTALDFVVDGIKQTALFPAVGYRLWLEAGQPLDPWASWPLWAALIAGPLVAGALMLTTFLRSPEVTGDGQRAHRQVHDRSPRGRLNAALSFLLNHPSWILVPVLFDRMEWLLIISLPLYALHAGASLLAIARGVCRRPHYERGPPQSGR